MIKKEMIELVEKLNLWGHQYYVLDNATVTDAKYDQEYSRLEQMEQETGVVLENSPTRRVGGEVIKSFAQHAHVDRLYSLDKAQNYEQLQSFVDKIQEAYPTATFSVELKYDGLALNLSYDNGKFTRATTRGNGIVGEDVTAQVLTVKNFPLTVDTDERFEVQGEGIMKLSAMEQFNRQHPDDKLKNARNGVAGAIRNLDPKVTAQRKISIILYAIGQSQNLGLSSQQDVVDFLQGQKFQTNAVFSVVENFEEIKKLIAKIDRERSGFDFLIDGVVVKVNQFDIRKKLGFTSKFPKWAMAYKFEAEQAETKLLDVVWQVGRTGKLTPVAELESVELCGATINRATLNNQGDIERKQLKINSRVLIRRSNDVIPEVLGLVENMADSREIVVPSVCPNCNSGLVERGAHLFCPNTENCLPQIVGKLVHYCSKNACNIEGVSEKTAQQLCTSLGVDDVSKLYFLKKEQLETLEKFKERKVQNTLEAIEKSKDVGLGALIFALGIGNVGQKTGKDLARRFGTIEGLKNASMEELVAIQDVGEVVAQSILEFFANEKNQKILSNLKEIGINPTFENTQGKFTGKKFVLTGSLQNFSRKEACDILEKLGGQMQSAVSKTTDILIAGDKAGSKLKRAQELGIEVWNEQKFATETGVS